MWEAREMSKQNPSPPVDQLPNRSYSAQFIVPSRAKTAIKIVAPTLSKGKTKTTSESSSLNDTSTKPNSKSPNVINQDESKKPDIKRENLSKSNEPSSQNHIQKSKNPISTLSEDRKDDFPEPQSTQQSKSIQSSLDIYAPNYIPLWLRAVNDSFATSRQCSTLSRLNVEEYIRKFAGSDFLTPLTSSDLPPATIPAQRLAASSTDLSIENYSSLFNDLLQNEYDAHKKTLQDYSIYEVSFEVDNPQQHLFRFSIPGIREESPCINLGDLVLIRTLLHPFDSRASNDAQSWYDHGRKAGAIAPGFSGLEYVAVVWGVSRTWETIILKMDGFDILAPRLCNIIFVEQASRYRPLWHSINQTAKGLKSNFSHRSWLRSMIFPEKEDCVLQFTLSKGVFHLNWFDEDLNYEQQKAVNAILTQEYGRLPYLISGPPGTGKTKTLVEIILQLLQSPEEYHHLLVCAPSDPAADTIAIRLAKHLKPEQLFRLNGWTRSFAEVPESLMQYSHIENDLFSLPNFKTMMKFEVVVTTCRDADILNQVRLTNSSLGFLQNSMNSILSPLSYEDQNLHWTGLLIDEAAQATEPEVLMAMSVVDPFPRDDHRQEIIPKTFPFLVMAGDEYQLGPRLAERSTRGLGLTLFERLFKREVYSNHPLSRSKGMKQLTSSMLPIFVPQFANLVRNYRSHPAILSTSSLLFYNDTLITQRNNLSKVVRDWPGWSQSTHWPVLFKQNSSPDAMESILAGNGTGAGGLFNPGEISLALRCVRSILQYSESHEGLENEKVQPDQIMVMSPFTAQVARLRTAFRSVGLRDVNIGPLEAFQGLEKRIVILCTTRTSMGGEENKDRFVKADQSRGLGVIDEPQRFNVALTRAKEGLIVIGNSSCLTCTSDRCWANFLKFCQRNKCHPVTDKIVCGEISYEKVGRLEKALKYKAVLRERENQDSKTRNANARKNFLKGNIPDSYEEMWRNGLDMEETDGHTLDEQYDYWPNGSEMKAYTKQQEVDSAISNRLKSGSKSGSKSTEVRTDIKSDHQEFDRDFIKEYEREKEGCETQ